MPTAVERIRENPDYMNATERRAILELDARLRAVEEANDGTYGRPFCHPERGDGRSTVNLDTVPPAPPKPRERFTMGTELVGDILAYILCENLPDGVVRVVAEGQVNLRTQETVWPPKPKPRDRLWVCEACWRLYHADEGPETPCSCGKPFIPYDRAEPSDA